MFIRTTRNGAGQAYYHLVESYRADGKVKQRTLLSLGRVEDGKLEELAEAIAKHTNMLCALDIAKSISVEQTYVLGPLLVLERLFERLGIDAALARVDREHPKQEFSLRDVVFSLVAARFVRPTSKLAVYEGMRERLYPALVPDDIELQHLYRAMSRLCEHKDDIEKSLFLEGRDLFSSEVDVVLYDLTTLRFESTREDTGALRRFGYSKEMRSDCTQVVLGLLVDPDGIPLGFEVYPGNTVEGKTLSDIVKKMREKFRVRRFIFVADRGLLSKDNLDTIRKADGEFLVGMRIGALGKKRPELFDRTRFSKLTESLEILETTFGEDRGLVTWSSERAERDRKVRDDILEKIRKKLANKKKVSAKTFVSNSNYHFFLKGLDTGTPALDQSKIAAAAKKDGFFALVTNIRDVSAADLYAQYKQLWKIEDTFGELKGTLKARPIFHWTDKNIVGHLTMCFLSLLCEAHITKALRNEHDVRDSRAIRDGLIEARPLSAVTVFHELAEVRAVPVTVGKQTLWVRTDIRGHVAKIFQRLGLRIPPRLLKTESVVAQVDRAPASL
jgi:transposase